jgi:four helix bundle protein
MKTELEDRTKRFSLNLISILKTLPQGYLGEVIGRQLLKSGTSIGANYRETNRAYSKADFVHKVNLAEKEAAETVYWLEICMEAGLGTSAEIERLAQEAKELLAILTTLGRNTKR